jgi:predicted tellurium resistance membrane protein TerC
MSFTSSVKSYFKNKQKRKALLIGMGVAFVSTSTALGLSLASKGQELGNQIKQMFKG